MAATVKKRKPRTAGHNGAANGYFPVRFILDQERDGFTIPETARTLQGFREWSWSKNYPQHGRISYLGGEIVVDMSKERAECHVKVKAELYRVLTNLTAEQDLGEFFTDGMGVTNVAANVSHVPDAVFVSWQSYELGRVHKVPSKAAAGDYVELEGSPDWILEVVSPSSVYKDTERLPKLYHRAGILEYWLVDARGDKIDFQIYRWEAKAYVPQSSRGGWQVSPVFGRHFRLKRAKNRIGDWHYDLEMKQ
ncbi:MAG: Uma2 family endonuclease [Gemmataceae bacterium]|nr:Uma2 family endonuclease [Gemmataceae bacterium]